MRRLYFATSPEGGVRAFWHPRERDAFVAKWAGNASVRAVTFHEIKKFHRATLPGGRRRFILPDGSWIDR
jgi:hypothetical protein